MSGTDKKGWPEQASPPFPSSPCPLCLQLDRLELQLLRRIQPEGLRLCAKHMPLVSDPAIAKLASSSKCSICAELERQALQQVASQDQNRLCYRHLLMLRKCCPESYREAATARLHWLRDMVSLLDEYFRKEDYRFRHEARGPEQLAYLEILNFLAGPPDRADSSSWPGRFPP